MDFDFWSSVRRIRRSMGLTQSALGENMGMDQSYVSRLESGRVNPELATLKALAKALNAEIVLVPRRALGDVLDVIDRLGGRRQGRPAAVNSVFDEVFVPDPDPDGDDDFGPIVAPSR